MLGPSDSSYDIPTGCRFKKKVSVQTLIGSFCLPAGIISGGRGAEEQGAANLEETMDVRRW
jgi:hypothetical protein